ncbi:hypothetical protein GCM10011391_24230 [Pullulanibacillus camelliae]|uniref:Lipoprotein n=1 Tax=Pullulanibacillus camelliae TaxID=1707096 RepID=A0A8J2YI59_9BACL|nr:hypothetical protein [Pullulanibacillus camelliae]GGE44586.1 hypothetical protein GCM10011391_24230 [Pullulanibacillus camelliae]
MKKTMLFLSFILLLISLSACASFNQVDEDSLQNQVIYNIQKHHGKEINFKEAMSGFDWEKVYIFTPHTSINSINKQIGFKWLTHKQGIQYRDDINLVAFVKDNQVVHSVEISRKYGDFVLDSKNGFDKDHSVLQIKKANAKNS